MEFLFCLIFLYIFLWTVCVWETAAALSCSLCCAVPEVPGCPPSCLCAHKHTRTHTAAIHLTSGLTVSYPCMCVCVWDTVFFRFLSCSADTHSLACQWAYCWERWGLRACGRQTKCLTDVWMPESHAALNPAVGFSPLVEILSSKEICVCVCEPPLLFMLLLQIQPLCRCVCVS